jgi:hypothetical protein
MPDPRETFEADQAEGQTREATTWALSVRAGEANAMMTEGHAMLALAKAKVWRTLATGITMGFFLLYALTILSYFGLGAWS